MDTLLAIAMAIIACANIILTFCIFKQTRKDNSEGEKKQRKFELIQTLILNNRLPLLYAFYDSVTSECQKLQKSGLQSTKDAVNKTNKALLKRFRHDFMMLFIVIDHQLYDDLKKIADELIDGITEAIYDDGINLTHEPKFNEMITEPLARNRNSMLAKLYEISSF